jgi:hypothetical protein
MIVGTCPFVCVMMRAKKSISFFETEKCRMNRLKSQAQHMGAVNRVYIRMYVCTPVCMYVLLYARWRERVVSCYMH